MKQYNTFKAKYPDALLLFRIGDFYETFGSDAIRTSEILGIVLTKRANGSASYIELAGFPYHSLDTYLPKLVRAGHRVAICEQLEDPKATKTIVKRGVTELVTPGVSYNDKLLDHKQNNFLAAVHFGKKDLGIALLDISTGEFLVSEGDKDHIDKLLQSFRPGEIIYLKSRKKDFLSWFGDGFFTYTLEDWVFTQEYAGESLNKHFQTLSLKGFGVDDMEDGIIAAGAALYYLGETQHDKLGHITSLSRIDRGQYVWLDRFTIRNLELVYSPNEGAVTLLDVLDNTLTPMGGRLLRRWILLPLRDKLTIHERLEMVNNLLNSEDFSKEARKHLRQIGDLERLISKVALGKIGPREMLHLGRSLSEINSLKMLCEKSELPQLKRLAEQLNPCHLILDRIKKEMKEDSPALAIKGGFINEGVDADLDELRQISFSGKDYLVGIQQRESERTGINRLKIGFNNVFGYYIEVTHSNRDKVPADWVRKQTLVNAERYITEELKVYEEKILGAEEKILELENRLFNELIATVSEYIEAIKLNATLLSRLDCLQSFAKSAEENHYCRPELSEDHVLEIKDGRHPVIEKHLPPGESYVSNDLYLDTETQQIIIITGPNMSGKSAMLRQTALIALMAQMGSYVPAKSAHIGLVDKIFTRVGASDNLSSGESTFMVEMNETASILNNLSERSLILLDEIGRGTSTYDGISIAWAIVEFLHQHPQFKPRTLFATHYHELNDLAETMPRVKNFNASVKESGNRVIFLRKLVPGGSEHSFGIHVARMAGMPVKVVSRATDVLNQMEESHARSGGKSATSSIKDQVQLSFFQLDDPVLEQIKEELLKTDINTLTPVEALMKLNDIKKLMGK